MSFLRRLLGGRYGVTPVRPAATTEADPVADELERERRLLREEAERLDDALIQRQLRYADRAWVPPAQGGSRRADDAEASAEGE